MHQAVRKLTVIHEQQQTARIVVEASNRNNARQILGQQLRDSPSALRIAHCRNDAGGFVKREIGSLRRNRNAPAVNGHNVVFRNRRPELHNCIAVDGDASGDDQLFGFATRRDSGLREESLQTHHSARSFTKSCVSTKRPSLKTSRCSVLS